MASGLGRRERKVVRVLFAYLVGFTARSESLDPEDVEAILRPYHERLRTEMEAEWAEVIGATGLTRLRRDLTKAVASAHGGRLPAIRRPS